MVVGLTFLIFFGVAFLMFASGKSWMAGVVHKAQDPELFWFTLATTFIALPLSANLQAKISGFSPTLQSFFHLGLAVWFLLMGVTGFLYAGAAEMKGEVRWTFHKYTRGEKYYEHTLSRWRMSNAMCFLGGIGLLLFFLIGGRLTF
jgi:hypothetical protein